MARLTKLNISNFKRIETVEFSPKKGVTIIGGMNEQGKSSLLDSISVLLQGKTAKVPQPVRTGTKGARITGEIQSDTWDAFDSMTITRTISAKGTWSIKVETKAGVAKSPETMLKDIFGEPLDPVEFIKMSPGDRFNFMKNLVGVDFSKEDAERKRLYDERTVVGRDVARVKGVVDTMTVYPDAPDQEVKTSELMKELKEAQKINKENDKVKENCNEHESNVKMVEDRIRDLERQIKQLEPALWDHQKNLKETQLQVQKLQDVDEDTITAKINTIDETNQQVRANWNHIERSKELKAFEAKYKKFTDNIDKIDSDKASKMAMVKFPIPGLSFSDSEVLYKGLPMNEKQLSSEELIKVSFAIAIAARPNLRTVYIREGSLLDSNNLELIRSMAEEAKIDVFIEVVGDDPEASHIIIEGGKIKERPEPEATVETVPETVEEIEEIDFSDI